MWRKVAFWEEDACRRRPGVLLPRKAMIHIRAVSLLMQTQGLSTGRMIFGGAVGKNEEDAAQRNDGKGEVLPTCDAPPQRRIRFTETLREDTGSCVEKAEQCAEYPGGCVSPCQTQDDENHENQKTFSECFKKLRGVARIQVFSETITKGIVFPDKSQDILEEQTAGRRFGERGAGLCGESLQNRPPLFGGEGEKFLRELHRQRRICRTDATVEFPIDEVGHSPEEESDGTDDSEAVAHSWYGEVLFACVDDGRDEYG